MLFKRGREFNKLAKALNSLFVMLNELDYKINNNLSVNCSAYKEEIFIVAYLAKRAVIERIKDYKWPDASPIIVPYISKSFVTLKFASNQLFDKINTLSEKMNLNEEVKNIINKGNYYYQIEKVVPELILKSI